MPFASQSQAKRHCWTPCGSVLTKNHAPFTHQDISEGRNSQQLADCFGSAVFRADLPELAELDNLFYHRVSSISSTTGSSSVWG